MRAKYLDWCSARVAERFVKLTPEEIYALAEQATHGQRKRDGDARPRAAAIAAPAAASATALNDVSPSFKSIVERVTEALTAELALPGFAQWAAAYREDPSKFDDELLGLWREAR